MFSFLNKKNKVKTLNDPTTGKDDITTSDLFRSSDTVLGNFLDKRIDESDQEFSQKSKKSNDKDKIEWALNLKILPLSILAASFFSGSIFSYITFENIKSTNSQRESYFLKIEDSIRKIEKDALTMKVNPEQSLASLSQEVLIIEEIINIIENGGKFQNDPEIKALVGNGATQLNLFKSSWNEYRSIVKDLVIKKEDIIQSKKMIDTINNQSNVILNNTSRLQKELQKNNTDISFIFDLSTSVYRVLNQVANSNSTFLSEEERKFLISALDNIEKSLTTLNQTHKDSGDIKEVLKSFTENANQYLNKNKVLEHIVTLNNSNKLNNDLITKSLKTTVVLKDLAQNISGTNIAATYLPLLTLLLAILGTSMLGLISTALYARSLKSLRLANVFKKNQSNEEALVELINQIQPLDRGDFTKPIFIEDKFLLNVAKRIDKTRIQFGDIVRQMKESSGNILSAAEFTDTTSQELLGISKRQFEKLAEAISVISEITNSLDEVAQTAWIAQDESNRSSQESEKGKKLVDQSIEKMNEIRNNIQESSKKIKKLGESAQSITEVTSLIKDITKQINILALNAAIQAASSGESGREFTVVAQEVQRLADDSESATQKIEELINDIQSDTAVAIASMEKTTQEVVLGAQLTQQAGIVLNDINASSKNTAEQIQSASSRLEEKSTEMAHVTVEMQGLQAISKEAQEAVKTTTTQVESLKKISEELEKTFKQYKV